MSSYFNESRQLSPRPGNTVKSPNRISPSRNTVKSPNRITPSRNTAGNTARNTAGNTAGNTARNTARNTAGNTVKRSPVAANINSPKPFYSEQIDRFKTYFEQSFANYDAANPNYKITKKMLQKYINTNIDDIDKRSIWYDVFINNRHLLYLDQYLNLLNIIISQQPKSIADLTPNTNTYTNTNTYFTLPIAKSVSRDISLQEITTTYSDSIYKKMVEYQSGILEKTTRNINDISLIYAHGIIFPSAQFIKVPDDIIIAFVIPINKYGYQISNDLENIKTTLIEMQNNPNFSEKQEFFNNPACSFRNTGCLDQTVYYYPGQYIPNFNLIIIPDENDKHKYFGIYKNLKEPIVKPIFEYTNEKYNLNISDILIKHHDYFEKQIIYIECCRKIDLRLTKQAVELLYRYEHIITHLNMSYCLSFANNSNKYKCRSDKAGTKHHKLAANTKNTSLFYDSATLDMFQSNKLPKYPKNNYMGETLEANKIISFISNPQNTMFNKEIVLIEVLKYLVDDLNIEYTDVKANKLKTIFENYIISESALINVLTNTKYIETLYNIYKKSGNDLLNIIFPLFIKYDFITIYKFIENMNFVYNFYIFIYNYINELELQNKLNLENVNKIFLYMISAELDMTLSDAVLQNIVLNRTNILYYLYQNDKSRPLLGSVDSAVIKPFITNLITLYYTKNIFFNYNIFLISRFTIDKLRNMPSLPIDIYFIFDTTYIDYVNLPDLNTKDEPLNLFLNKKKSLIYYAIFKENNNFIKILNDINQITKQYQNDMIFNILYILMLYKEKISYTITESLQTTIDNMINNMISEKSFHLKYNIIYLWFYKILGGYSGKHNTELDKFYISQYELLGKYIDQTVYNKISLNTDINERSGISSLIIKFMAEYSKILDKTNTIIKIYGSINAKQFQVRAPHHPHQPDTGN